jgi:hypothetical protein
MIRPGAAIALAALILLIPVYLNGFPFLFPDSGDYLVFTPRLYRSPYYGLFIFFFHMNRYIWLPVIAQAFITAHLLWLMLKLNGARFLSGETVALAALLCAFSSLPFFVGFIMADLFTPIMFVAMYILGFHYAALSRPLRVYLVLLATVATAAHVANLTMACGMLVLIAALLFWCERPRAEIIRRLGVLTIPIGLTAAAILLFNTLIFGTFALSPGGSNFLMAHLIEEGPARVYLEKACPSAGYKICAYADKLPPTADELLWSSGTYDKLGGFVGMKDESSAIVAATIKRYPLYVVRATMKNFVAGLFTHEPAQEFRPEYQVPSMTDLLAFKFGPKAVAAYQDSAEMRGTIPHNLIGQLDSVVVPAMFFALLGLGIFAAWRRERPNASLAMIVISAVLGNTFFCTAVSNLHDRYQARVTWLLPMAVFVIVSSMAAKRTAREK